MPSETTTTTKPQTMKKNKKTSTPKSLKQTGGKNLDMKKKRRVSLDVGESTSLDNEAKQRLDQITNPHDFVTSAFRLNGCIVTIQPSTTVSYFHEPTDKDLEDYTHEVVKAVREADLDQLRELHEEGVSLQCCNRFGEGLLHMACRRGYTDVVRLLVTEAECSLYCRDDYGRTPLHDACWSPKPNLDLVAFILKRAPQLLLLSDVRGHSPFHYVRKDHWPEWIAFLKEHVDLMQFDEKDDKITPSTTNIKEDEEEEKAVAVVG